MSRRLFTYLTLGLLLLSCNGDRGDTSNTAAATTTASSAKGDFWMSPDLPEGDEPFRDVPFLSADRGMEMTDAQAQAVLAGVDKIAPTPELISFTNTDGRPTRKPKDYLWRKTEHRYGYLAPDSANGDLVHAGTIAADVTLKNQPVKVTLNRLRVADYPGDGLHKVLFDFRARNQVAGGTTEKLHFNQVYRVNEGQGAGIIGYPIYLGLNVGTDGLSFEAYTVNVSNDADEKILGVVESDVGKQGLKLLTTAQPALAPFTDLASGIFRMVMTRRRNVPVQDVFVGLDFSDNQAGARLRTGDYVIVQVPDAEKADWNWSEWKYDRNSGVIVKKTDGKTQVPFNYFVLGVTKYGS